MLLLVLTAFVVVTAIVSAGKAALTERAFLKARYRGVQLQADIVDNDTSPSGRRGAYYLTPVVRYHLEGRAYTAAIGNASSAARSRGSSMTVVVDPEHPYLPFDRFGGMGSAARGSLLVVPLAVVLVVLAIALH